MKTAIICGAGGFIGSHLVRRLKAEGYWVRGLDIKHPEFSESAADDFHLVDLRDGAECLLGPNGKPPDEVYQLAATFGGMGWIESHEAEIMHDNVLINANVLQAAATCGVKRYFYSSSACVYSDMAIGSPALDEGCAYPALPDNEYGWEKLYSERMAMAFGRDYGMEVRIARFGNCYGPEGAWRGGREKAPAAICRKVAESKDGTIAVWGDGTAVRSYIYVDDLIDGIRVLMRSDLREPVNIGSSQHESVDGLVRIVAEVAKKKITIKHGPGPVGVRSRNFSNKRINSLGWREKLSLRSGIERTYPWIAGQISK